jgi:transglutaminase-like putative cysteine protease
MVCLLSAHSEHRSKLRRPETFVSTPEISSSTYCDLYGNTCRRFVAPAGEINLWGDGIIEDDGSFDSFVPAATEVPLAKLPDEVLVYLLGSRYCETDKLSQVAWDLFGSLDPGWFRVQSICDYVHNRIEFDYTQARATRSAFEAFDEKVGVCRDFAHLAIALCRCMNIPARYVNGYLGDIGVPIRDPMDFSAWMEVYLGDHWYTFDPRNNEPRLGRIVVSRGRDAVDVPLINSFGPHTLTNFKVWTYDVTFTDEGR